MNMLTPSSVYSPEQRKVRKGTHSCWECKRRKVSCRFASTSDTVCKNCKRRGTRCVSQAFPETDSRVSDTPSHIDLRLKNLEDSIEVLSADFQHLDRRDGSLSRSPQAPAIPRHSDWLPNSEFSQINGRLASAWPTDHTLQTILSLPKVILSLFHGTICGPVTPEIFDELTDLHKIFSLPSRSAHPVVFARPLLTLACHLQNFPPSSIAVLRDIGVDNMALRNSLVEAVNHSVTCNERLLNSIEGVECMLVEGMYMNNAGDIVGAWHLANRALLQARLMLLDRPVAEQRPNWLLAETQRRIDPSFMWFRLLQTTRYLSMMLGLPSHTPVFEVETDERTFQKCSPNSRLQRMQCVAGAHLSQRCGQQVLSWLTTQYIRDMLEAARLSMPLDWWSIPDFETCADDSFDSLMRVIQTMDQLAHFHLVNQLYFPHVLFPDDVDQADHARRQVLDANREVLLRYVALAGIHSISSFCRVISCLAFAACISLCFLRVQQGCVYDDAQSPSDRMEYTRDDVLLKSALAIMQRLSRVCEDNLATNLERVLGQLLDLRPVKAHTERSDLVKDIQFNTPFGWTGTLSTDGTILYIRVPGVAVVKFIGVLGMRGLNGIPVIDPP